MATKFAKVTLDGIENGQFMQDAEKSFQELASSLIEHFREHNKDGEAALSLKVKMSQKNGTVSIVTDIVKTLPKKPHVVTTALPERDEDGSLCLFSQSGQTHEGNPNQMVLEQPDGKPIV